MCHRRFFLIPLLAFGTIAGFASGFHSLAMHRSCGWHDDWRRAQYEQVAPTSQPPATINQPPVVPVNVQQAAPAPAPVTVQQSAPAAAPSQTLVIPIIVGAPQGTAVPAPTTYVIPTAPQAATQPAPTQPAPVPQPAPAK